MSRIIFQFVRGVTYCVAANLQHARTIIHSAGSRNPWARVARFTCCPYVRYLANAYTHTYTRGTIIYRIYRTQPTRRNVACGRKYAESAMLLHDMYICTYRYVYICVRKLLTLSLSPGSFAYDYIVAHHLYRAIRVPLLRTGLLWLLHTAVKRNHVTNCEYGRFEIILRFRSYH